MNNVTSVGSRFRISYKMLNNCLNKYVRGMNNRTPYTSTKHLYSNKAKLMDGPDLKSFLTLTSKNVTPPTDDYLPQSQGDGQKVYFEIYGCQMNVNDTEVVWAILKKHNYNKTENYKDADIILLVTCAIRDKAEEKIRHRLNFFNHLKSQCQRQIKIGLLGCMAERLKKEVLIKHRCVDVVAGPDSYRDLPRLLSSLGDYKNAINVMLSIDETYADITPIRLNPQSTSAYVSIMRGCDNMCTYCIVPFTRGRERSRPLSSIITEVQKLSDEGVKEIVLLGQNVNSYRDTSMFHNYNQTTELADGFNTVYKSKKGGLRFIDLLDNVSRINPEIRIRFTSPHPKDFPNHVLQLIADRPNICNQLHLPAQSGNNNVLNRMQRGYTREVYLNLIEQVRSIIPNVSLSSDFIAGFCQESEDEFLDTLSLIQTVKYNMAYLFAYSMREKTRAYRLYKDDVDKEIKLSRVQRMAAAYRIEAENLNRLQIGQQQLVLIEGTSKRSIHDLQGRNDGNTRVIIRQASIPLHKTGTNQTKPIQVGDYVVVQICTSNSQTLKGVPLYHSSIKDFHSKDITCLAQSQRRMYQCES